jgi:NAD(P)H-dependent FMN reductase
MNIFAISGSLRASSSNTALLRAVRLLAPDLEVAIYDGLASLPAFNPDDDREPLPPPVARLRAEVARADALLISSPEYAHGVPGSLKNALDWLVGGIEIYDKRVALINAAPRAIIAQAQLAETLRTMKARIVPAASVTLPLTGPKLDEFGIVADGRLAVRLRRAIDALTAVAPPPPAAA